jgi:hypothetical protein
MGLCGLVCQNEDQTNLDHRLSALEIHEKSNTSSDETLKAKGAVQRDKAPLLDGLDDQINDETAPC